MRYIDNVSTRPWADVVDVRITEDGDQTTIRYLADGRGGFNAVDRGDHRHPRHGWVPGSEADRPRHAALWAAVRDHVTGDMASLDYGDAPA